MHLRHRFDFLETKQLSILTYKAARAHHSVASLNLKTNSSIYSSSFLSQFSVLHQHHLLLLAMVRRSRSFFDVMCVFVGMFNFFVWCSIVVFKEIKVIIMIIIIYFVLCLGTPQAVGQKSCCITDSDLYGNNFYRFHEDWLHILFEYRSWRNSNEWEQSEL